MTNLERNIRTLIICFVLAMVGLVPLRILETTRTSAGEVKVLGESAEVIEEEVNDEENIQVFGDGSSVREVDDIVLPEVGGEE
jgi:hypothetical protein